MQKALLTWVSCHRWAWFIRSAQDARKDLVDEGQSALADELPGLPIDPFPDIFVYNTAKLNGPLGNNVIYGPFWNMNEWWCTDGAC